MSKWKVWSCKDVEADSLEEAQFLGVPPDSAEVAILPVTIVERGDGKAEAPLEGGMMIQSEFYKLCMMCPVPKEELEHFLRQCAECKKTGLSLVIGETVFLPEQLL